MSRLANRIICTAFFLFFILHPDSILKCSDIYLFEKDASLLITDTYSPGYTRKVKSHQVYEYSPAQGARLTVAYDRMIEEISERYSVSSALVKAIIKVESNFDPSAVSPKGAKGLMQLIDGTAQRFEVKDVFDPHENITGGVRYLKHLTDLFGGDLSLVLAGYNAGERAVLDYGGIPPFTETKEYVKSVKRLIGLSDVKSMKRSSSDEAKPYLSFTDKGTICITN